MPRGGPEARDGMSQLEEALRRLDGAVARLEGSLSSAETAGARAGGDGGTDLAALRAERDELAEEVRILRERAVEDARLRAEAARAVREALQDLRGAVRERHAEAHGNA